MAVPVMADLDTRDPTNTISNATLDAGPAIRGNRNAIAKVFPATGDKVHPDFRDQKALTGHSRRRHRPVCRRRSIRY